jgi:hypothetical protein
VGAVGVPVFFKNLFFKMCRLTLFDVDFDVDVDFKDGWKPKRTGYGMIVFWNL